MKMKNILKNHYGHLRTGWRIGAFLILIVPSLLPTIIILKLFAWLFPASGGEDLTSPINIVFMIGLAVSIVIASYINLRWIDKRPYELLGLNFSLSSIREFLIGCIIGFSNLILIVLILDFSGFLKITWFGINPFVLQTIFIYTLVFAGGAAIEELINRGYIFQALCEGTRTWIAVLLTSIVFSIVHVFNQNWSMASALFLFTHGVLYAVAYLKTRSLWTAIGVHWSWNFIQGPIFGIPVSGSIITNSLFNAQPQGSDIFNGGQFGVEGSILSSLISFGFVVFVCKTKWLAPSKRMVSLWNQYPKGFKLDP
jgi:membrane protease YdiL (CAAX protease family)